jgi:hypothetical protein
MGAPTKFTPQTVKLLISGVRTGLSYRVAAEAAGVSYDAFLDWRKGEFPESADEALKVQFSEGITRARAQGIKTLHNRIVSASTKDWRAALALLERIDPDTYGRQRLELTGKDGSPIELTHLVDDRIAAIARQYGISEDAVRARLAKSRSTDREE